MYNNLVSIVIPTFNSEKTLKFTLDSIKKQSYNKDYIEILVVDGGSSDKTREIADEYSCLILENPNVQQEYAKYIGLRKAKGKYLVFMDSDEAFDNQFALENRVNVLQNNLDVKIILMGGLKKPDGFSDINDYVNTFSEPFSFFMYGLSVSADSFYYVNNILKIYKLDFENEIYAIFKISDDDVLPLADSGCTTYDLDYIRNNFQNLMNDTTIIPRLSALIMAKTKKAAIIKDDAILHYSIDSLKGLLGKIRWKIISNIHYSQIPGTGFANRESMQPFWFRMKKFLFIIYAFSFIGPIIHSFYYAIKRKKKVNLLHFPITLYTATTILFQFFLKFVGIKPGLKTYGKENKKLNLT